MRCRKCDKVFKKPKFATRKTRTCNKCRTETNVKPIHVYWKDHSLLVNRPVWISPQEIINRRMAHNLAEQMRKDHT